MAAADTPTKPTSDGDAVATVTTEDFVRAFNKQRTTLAGFSRCSSKEELDIVRDGFYLGLAKDLCPDAYKAVLVLVLRKRFNGNSDHISEKDKPDKSGIVEEGNQGMLSLSFEEMVLAARVCDESSGEEATDENDNNSKSDTGEEAAPTTYWKDLVNTVLSIGETVGSDLESIWKTLEDGRLDWLRAASAAHPIKLLLKKALEDDGALESAGDVSDAMMVWIYSICVALADGNNNEEDASPSQMGAAVDKWLTAVNMVDKHNPLKGYQAELWDPRRDEWRALDLGAQEAAEKGGANLLEAWKA
jgi:hypothetical protein